MSPEEPAFSLLSGEAEKLMDGDIRPNTKKVYRSAQNTFKQYCEDIGYCPEKCSSGSGDKLFGYFIHHIQLQLSYCAYRSAISKMHVGVEAISMGKMLSIKRLTRAIFIANPPLPRYVDVWDVNKLLSYMGTMHP